MKCDKKILHIRGQVIISAIVDDSITTTPKIKIQTRLDNDIILAPEDVDEFIENYLKIKKEMEDDYHNTIPS